MKLISFDKSGRRGVGALHATRTGEFIDLAETGGLPGDIVALLADPEGLAKARQALNETADASASWQRVAGVRLLPVVPRPGKIICVGLNYADHAKEGGNARPDYPSFFYRGGTSLIAHDQGMTMPRVSDKFDFEAELAVIIGSAARHVTQADALNAVAGYACFNDATLRDYQRRTAQWTLGKNFDGTGAFGPHLVTPEEVSEGAVGLDISSVLNGQVMQQSNTRHMLWPVAELIAILSECMTLEPGDVIATGTPAGVGYARTPPVWMRPGDTIEIVIEGVGRLGNPVVQEAGATMIPPKRAAS